MLKGAQTVSSLLLATRTPCWCAQQIRTALVFRRMYPPRLGKVGHYRPTLKKREYVYILEDDTNVKPAGDIDAILTKNVEAVGLKGDRVIISKSMFRNMLYPAGAAIYASPENIEQLEKQQQAQTEEVPRPTMSAQKTVRMLGGLTLPIAMSPATKWQLNKSHVRIALRQAGVQVPESCIQIPTAPITEPTELDIKLTVNKLDTVTVKAFVYHYEKDVPLTRAIWQRTKIAKGSILPDS